MFRFVSTKTKNCLLKSIQFNSIGFKNQSQSWRMIPIGSRNHQIISDQMIGKRRFSTPNGSLPPYIILRYCPSSSATKITDIDHNASSPRPLLILFAWLLSRDKDIEKYRKFWFDRGFDVLSVHTPPKATIFTQGAQKIAKNLFNVIKNHRPLYDEIMVHAFSVGGYQFCEFLQILEQTTTTTTNDNLESKSKEQIYNSLRGVIMDSIVFPEEAPLGFSLTLTNHPTYLKILSPIIESIFYLKRSSTIGRFEKVFDKLYQNPKKIPGLMFYCKNDIMSNPLRNYIMHQGWKINGIISDYICWEKSSHVQHYRFNPKEYEQKIDEFCSKLNLKKMIPFTKN